MLASLAALRNDGGPPNDDDMPPLEPIDVSLFISHSLHPLTFRYKPPGTLLFTERPHARTPCPN